jgi:hypothetical protein
MATQVKTSPLIILLFSMARQEGLQFLHEFPFIISVNNKHQIIFYDDFITINILFFGYLGQQTLFLLKLAIISLSYISSFFKIQFCTGVNFAC